MKTRHSSFSKKHEMILLNVSKGIYSEHINDTFCTALVETPGPYKMAFITIKCDLKLRVSGIMCLKGGKQKGNTPEITYTFYHWFPWVKSDDLLRLYPKFFNHLNLVNLNAHNSSRTAVSEESLQQQRKENNFHGHGLETLNTTHPLKWKYELHFCSLCGNTSLEISVELCSICKAFRYLSELNTKRIIHLFRQLVLPPVNITTSLVSVEHFETELRSTIKCEKGDILLQDQCARINRVNKPAITTIKEGENAIYTETCNFVNRSVCSLPIEIAHKTRIAGLISSFPNGRVSFLNKGTGKCLIITVEQKATLEIINSPCRGNAAEYVLCCHPPILVSCPPSYILCEGECIADSFNCGESTKQNICAAHFAPSAEYCFTKCHMDNCSCHNLYFQCQSGGCLHTGKLCDGQGDCLYREDEALCDGKKDRQYGHDSLRQLNYDSLFNAGEFVFEKGVSTNGAQNFSIHVAKVPCMGGYPKLYPVDKQCVYDRVANGLLRYCENGDHLKGCTSQSDVQCSGTFKCYQSYCIPVHMVCDGILDCPYGDDESHCPIQYCQNMLHCEDMCVHPNEICDGINQCKDGQDELLCGAPVCPEGCDCLGYSVVCTSVEPNLLSSTELRQLKMLTIRHSRHGYSLKRLNNLLSLLILDLSHSKKQITVDSELTGFGNLRVLLMSNNSFDNVADGFFQNSASLRELDMSWNPITHLNELALRGLDFLMRLNLRHCNLRAISSHTFSEIVIQSLDISMNLLAGLDFYCVHGNSNHIQLLNVSANIIEKISQLSRNCVQDIISDQVGLYCLEKLQVSWISNVKDTCTTLLSRPLLVYTCTVTVLIIFGNLGAFMYNVLVCDLQAALSAMLVTVNLVMAVPLYVLIRWHIEYKKEFAYHEYFLQNDPNCKLVYATLFLSTEMSVSIWLLISAYKWYGINNIKRIVSSHVKMCTKVCPVCICLIWFSVIIPFTPPTNQSPHSINGCIFGSLDNSSLLSIGVINILSCLCLLALYFSILRGVRDNRLLIVGKKHGNDTFKALSVRVCVIMVISVFCILPPSIIMICVSLWGSSVQYTSEMLVLIPLQASLYPFIHTFSMPKFLRSVRNIGKRIICVSHKRMFNK